MTKTTPRTKVCLSRLSLLPEPTGLLGFSGRSHRLTPPIFGVLAFSSSSSRDLRWQEFRPAATCPPRVP